MIYPEVIRAYRFRCRNPLLAEDFRLQPQLVAVVAAAVALETKLNSNNYRLSFWFNDPSYIA